MLSLPVLVTTSAVVMFGVAASVLAESPSMSRRSAASSGQSAVAVPSSPVAVVSSVDSDIIGDIDGSNDGYGSYCETETFHATCALDEVIVMTRALYGRMRISRCVKLDYGHLGCVADVLELADVRCSGRRRCEIRIPDPEFARNKPCPEDLKPYLEAGYKCVKVQTARDFCIYPRPTPVSGTPTTGSTSGFLASLVTELTGCGSVLTPWLIVARPGQTIRVTLHDYAVARTRSSGNHPRSQSSPSSSSSSSSSAAVSSTSSSQQCQAYAVLREPESKSSGGGQAATGGGGGSRGSSATGSSSRMSPLRNVTVCGGVMRQSVVYVTVGSRLEIGFERGSEQASHGAHYLIEYQAIGCEDPTPSPNSVSLRNGDLLTVKCNFSMDIYQRRCKDGRWTGQVTNCSYGMPSNTVERLATQGLSMPYGLSIMLVVMIALVIGAFVLCGGLIVLNRRGAQRRRRYHCCGDSDELAFCSSSDGVGAASRTGDFIDIYGTTHRLVSGVSTDLVHQQLAGSGPLLQHQIVGGTVGGAGSEKAQYVTAALVRHIGGSMAARAAAAVNGHQLNDSWDVVEGLTGENTSIERVKETGNGNCVTSGVYGYGVMRPNDVTAGGNGSMTIYGTAVTLDSDRSLRSSATVSSRLTTRVYPPMADYYVGAGGGGGGGSSSLYGRLPCGCCETYSTAGCSASVSPTSRSPASSQEFRHVATLATFDSSRRQNRRNLVTSTGNGNHSHYDDDKKEFDFEESTRIRREAMEDSTNAHSLLHRDVVDESSTDQQQRPPPETRDRPSVADTISVTVKSRHGCVVSNISREKVDDHCDGETTFAELQDMTGNATIQPPSYIVPELLSDCTLHGSGRIQRELNTP